MHLICHLAQRAQRLHAVVRDGVGVSMALRLDTIP